MAKYSQSDVNYTDSGTPKEHCSNYENYVNPTTCAIVAGRIVPGGWCDKWAANIEGRYANRE